jgi:hypothetical protein
MSKIEIIEPEELSRIFEEPTIKADLVAEEVAKAQVNDLTSKTSQAAFDRAIDIQEAASRKVLSGISEELKINGNDISIAVTDLEVNNIPEAQLAQTNPTAYNSFKNLVERTCQTIEDIIKRRTNTKVETLIDENNKAAEEYYKDPTNAVKKNAFKTTQDALRKALLEQPDQDVKKLQDEVEKSKKGNWKKWSETIIRALKVVGIALSIYFVGKALVDAETGCYMYKMDSNGTLTSTKIPCPIDKDDAPNCRCGVKDETCASNTKLPYCCNAGSIAYNKPCKGEAGKPDSIYYGWKQQTFAGFVNDLLKGINDALKNLPQELGNLFGGIWKILKYVLIGILVIVGLVVLIYILRFLFSLFGSSSDKR